jgi:hypothetical protein
LKNVLTQYEATGGEYTLIKYQMSWPGTGDPYYTQEGYTKRVLYNVTGVPALYIDGLSKTTTLANVIAAQAVPCYVEVSGIFNVVGQTVTAKIEVTPTIAINEGNSLRLYVAIVEKTTVKNKKNNGESIFYQVMKKFMPNASGIILGDLVANETITEYLSWEFQGNYRLPNSANDPINHAIEHSIEDFDNLEVVAWVQNSSSKVMHNSGVGLLYTDPYPIVFNVTGKSGSIIAEANGEPVNSGDELPFGTTVKLTATPDECYKIKEWKLNGKTVAGNTNNSISTIILDYTTIVEVEFEKENDGKVNFNVTNGNGTITATVEGEPINSGNEVEVCQVVEFTAIPNKDYAVLEWKLNGTVVPDNTTNNLSVQVVGDQTVTVQFVKVLGNLEYMVTNGNGTLTATVDGESVNSGDKVGIGNIVEFTADPNENYIVKEWKLNGTVVSDNISNNYSLTFSDDATVTVEFEENVGLTDPIFANVQLFPNPVKDELIINNAELIQKITITNTLGQLVNEYISTGKQTEVISTQHLQSGVFFITLTNKEGNSITKKIIKE